MSKNIKYSTYTVISYPYSGAKNKPRVAVFGDLEIQSMIRYVQQENESENYMQITRETKTINYHLSNDNFPWLKTQEIKKGHFNVERWCRLGEPNSPNAGFFEWLGYSGKWH